MKNYQAFYPHATIIVGGAMWGLYWWPIRALDNLGLHGIWSVVFLNIMPFIMAVCFFMIKFNGIKMANAMPALFIGFALGVSMFAYATAFLYTDVLRVVLFFYLTPVWSTILGIVFLHETLSTQRVIAIFVGFFGLALILYEGESFGFSLNIGDILGLLAGFLWSVGSVLLKKLKDVPTKLSVLSVSFFVLLVGIIAGIFIEPLPNIQMNDPYFLKAGMIAFFTSTLLILPSMVAIFWAFKFVSPGTGGVLMMSEVVVAAISAVILLPNESLLWYQQIGGAFILFATIIEIRSSLYSNE